MMKNLNNMFVYISHKKYTHDTHTHYTSHTHIMIYYSYIYIYIYIYIHYYLIIPYDARITYYILLVGCYYYIFKL